MNNNGKFFCTFFENINGSTGKIIHTPGNVTTYPDADPYHYTKEVFLQSIEGTKWTAEYIGDWNHPRNQKMILFIYNE